jgi:hypothetical protein
MLSAKEQMAPRSFLVPLYSVEVSVVSTACLRNKAQLSIASHFKLVCRADKSYLSIRQGVQWKHALKESYGYPWGMRLSDETGFDRPAALAKRPLIIAVRGEHEAQATLSWTISDSWSCTSGRDVTVFDSG